MLEYNNFLQHIKEGLIQTWNIIRYSDSLEMRLFEIGLNCDINIESKFIYNITINNVDWLKKDIVYDDFFRVNTNLMGYFVTNYTIYLKNGMKKIFKFNENEFKTNLNIDNIDKISIRFESMYEDGAFKNNIEIPEKLYHISPSQKRNKILNNGLEPKTGYRLTNHPSRIYLFFHLKDTDDLLKKFKINDMMKEVENSYDLYEINGKNLNIIIHTDPNFFNNGCYTFEPISPHNIKLIKKNLQI